MTSAAEAHAPFVMFYDGDIVVFADLDALERYVESWYARDALVFDRLGRRWTGDVRERPEPRRSRFGLGLPSDAEGVVFSLAEDPLADLTHAVELARDGLGRAGMSVPSDSGWGAIFESIVTRIPPRI